MVEVVGEVQGVEEVDEDGTEEVETDEGVGVLETETEVGAAVELEEEEEEFVLEVAVVEEVETARTGGAGDEDDVR